MAFGDAFEDERSRDFDSPFLKYKRQRSKPKRLKIMAAILGVLALGLFLLLWSTTPEKVKKHDQIKLQQKVSQEPLQRRKKKMHCDPDPPKQNATLVMLVRNFEIDDALSSMRQIEDRFNRRFRYTWTFLNDEEFTEEFIQLTSGMASGETEYGLVPKEEWSWPELVDRAKARTNMRKMEEDGVIYGGSLTYRHMCRYNSGFFFRHPLLLKYDYYWRVEPSIEFYCDLNYDPFKFMKDNNKAYGFVIAMPEYPKTIPTLWDATQRFAAKYPKYIDKNNAIDFIVDGHRGLDGTYNMCHFWSNFEIGDLNFWRGEAYMKYFEWLDEEGGFYYERWGDAPVHSIAAALLLPKDRLHHFADIGYKHTPWLRCPSDDESYTSGRCLCNRQESFDEHVYSCLPRWFQIAGRSKGSQPYRPSY
ncbi:putative alpha-1,2-mannosyltransferase [Myxozyma melibiosi]|uniref:Alpha-1,2-mannosyltransferase n=1 Tax=Myxozyma melibiosi TaxID=54550 RepID=A0ABR1FAJ4_9ASCO